MILSNAVSNLGPGLAGIIYCASLWILTIFLVLCHRSGIQIVGGVIAGIGFLSIFINPAHMLFSLTLFFVGCLVHWFGRILHHLKNHN